ncbi:MAG: membrane protease subunit [Vampirovibrionia bacterium]
MRGTFGSYKNEHKKMAIISAIVVVLAFAGMLIGQPLYNVWVKGLNGKAQLNEAEWNRQIIIKEAEAKKQAAKSLAEAEVERAKGVAEANKIIGKSLQDNESYLRYLWIQGLQDGNSEVIYVPTETNLPILEAGRLNKISKSISKVPSVN